MSAPRGYQPFAITNFESGQFQYYQPWISPDDAFNPLSNAYVFRGQIQKRAGTAIYGKTGQLRYTNNEIVDKGDGVATNFTGTLSNFPLEPNSVTVTSYVGSSVVQATDDGSGNLTGALVSAGSTIDYLNGDYELNINGGPVVNNRPIVFEYTFTNNLTDDPNTIVMIAEHIDELTNAHTLVVSDTSRACYFNTTTQLFMPISTISQLIWVTDTVQTTTPTLIIGWTNIAPYSVSITDGTNTITDNGIGGFTTSATLNTAGTSNIDYTTGVITVTFTAYTDPTNITIEASIQGDYFTGDYRNLFNYVNWRSSESAISYLYMTNNVDRVTAFDGTNLARPPFGTTLANVNNFVNDISRTLDVKVYNESLLLIRPTSVGKSYPDAQMIRASAVSNPNNFATNVPGNGSFVSASTADWIMSASYLKDAIVIEFEDSCFVFRSTGNVALPFRFYKINSTLSTNAPYGSIEYDTFTTSMGAKGLGKCDGISKIRYDVPDAIDLYKDIDENGFALCQGKRFDVTQQSWMIYPSDEKDPSNTNCDKVIVFNWLEETWATYDIALSCIGSAKTYSDRTWESFVGLTWQEVAGSWNASINQDLVPWMLGGDTKGYIYFLNNENVEMDKVTDFLDQENGTLINANMVSKRWNPFVKEGQKATFGYVDFYYKVKRNTFIVENQAQQIVLDLKWYVNNSDTPALIQNMTLDTPATGGSDEQYAWKRMYVNLTGQFLQLEISSSTFIENRGQFFLAGIVLWAEPAGRLTPGTFI